MEIAEKTKLLNAAKALGLGFHPSTKGSYERLMPQNVADKTSKLHNALRDKLFSKVYHAVLTNARELYGNTRVIKTSYGYWLERIPTALAEFMDESDLLGDVLPDYETFSAEMAEVAQALDEQGKERSQESGNRSLRERRGMIF